MSNSLIFQIHFKLLTLSEAEQAVANYVLAHTKEVVYLSTQELAKRSGVSNATITRFCKSVGAKGFPDLKIMLSSERTINKETHQEIKVTDSLQKIKHQLNLRMTAALNETEQLIQDQSIKSCTTLLKNAEEIIIYGTGTSELVAKDLAQKFMRLGKAVLHTQDLHLITTALATQQKKKVAIFISSSDENKTTHLLATVCHELTIPIISIVSNPSSPLALKSTVVLVHSPIEEEDAIRAAATTSIVAQQYIINVLYHHYFIDNYDVHINLLNHTHQLTQKYLTNKNIM